MTQQQNNSDSLIIEDPSLQTLGQRYGWYSVTFIFWVLYIYLWLPAITLLAWFFGYQRFTEYFINSSQALTTSSGIGLYLIIVAIIAVIFLGWAKIEQARFTGKQRRSNAKPVTTEEMAAHWEINAEHLASAQYQKRTTIHFTQSARIQAIEN